jgi:glycosyltransferase involved in cell wall biosynthesis
MKIVLITNIPAPYRVPVFAKIAEKIGDNFLVIFAARTEPNRSWNIQHLPFNHLFLNENIIAKSDGFNFVHNNTDVFRKLKEFDPDVVITTGFNPTHLYGWMYAKLFRKKHISMTDGTKSTESHLTLMHRIIRRVVYVTSQAFISPSECTKKLFQSYKIAESKIFKSPLSVNNDLFKNMNDFDDRPYDLMFSGQFTERKLPFFFAEIAQKVSKNIDGLKVLILGDGPLKNEFFQNLDQSGIDYTYAGFVKQEDLPKYYGASKLFLFTTRLDAWGVVSNEALASGTPVIVTPYAGVANDLVIDSFNGYVIDRNSDLWAEKIIEILNIPSDWKRFSENSFESVKDYTFENAAKGILDACTYASKSK